MDINWRVDAFDEDSGAILSDQSTKESKKAFQDYSVIINFIGNKINQIFRWYLMVDQPLTIELFERNLANFDSRQDFLLFWQQTVDENYEKGLIKKGSWKQQSILIGGIEAL